MKNRPRMYTALPLLILTVVLSCPAWCAAQAPDAEENASRLLAWDARAKEVDALLLEGEYRKARKELDRLIQEMVDEILDGDAKPMFATVSLLRALAEAGLGNERAALWDLHVAKTLDERIGGLTLTSYGEAGEFLTRVSAAKADEKNDRKIPKDAEIEAPRKKKEPTPRYPIGKRFQCVEDLVALQSVIDEKGLPQRPTILSAEDSVLGFVALQALRDWRFEPAKYQGEPISVYYNLRMNFHVPHCGQ